MGFQIREADESDLEALLGLYTHLHGNPFPVINGDIKAVWRRIMSDPNHHILVGTDNGEPVSSCVIVIIENLTHEQRPYALVENVVTHPGFRGKGYATAVLSRAKEIAQNAGCYKIMLLTGSKKESTLSFYRRAGYNSTDKTAFIQWLGER